MSKMRRACEFIVAGTLIGSMAVPGMTDSLKLQNYEPTEELSIPDYVEVTADVADFELELIGFYLTLLFSGPIMEKQNRIDYYFGR
ncbi:hypothetical protein ACQRBN_00335 [Bariatricus sp. SGI.154]|uniref:hypothetical protein n=1 Tax=Bariatricus sp. SGI.154 TaxID=3420549 RepID=UPI003D051864